MRTSLIILILGLAQLSTATNVDPAHHYAYGANTGWIEARGDVNNGAVVGACYCTGYMYSANTGWINLGNVPANGWAYGNASATDWGVNHDGGGLLTGYAYGANIGWITFEQVHGRPRIDLATGDLHGYAWSANTGWISLNNAQAKVRIENLDPGPDQDHDGIPDPWELKNAGNLGTLSGNGHDQDQDGTPDSGEYASDTDPLDHHAFLRILSYQDWTAATRRVSWPSVLTRQYRVEQAPSPSGPWTDAGPGLLAPVSTPTHADLPTPPETDQVYRVRAIVPLSE